MNLKTYVTTAVIGLVLAIGVGHAIGSNADPAIDSSVEVDPLTDGKIAMIAVIAGNIDITYAHLAMALSSNPTVRGFAQTMLADHASVNGLAGKLVGELGIEPVESEVSRQLRDQSQAIVDELTGLRGAAFDRRYAANELGYHEFVNTALRDQFIPAAQNEEFRGALEQALVVFEGHERLAQEMVESVNR